jgi:hypothetical protein
MVRKFGSSGDSVSRFPDGPFSKERSNTELRNNAVNRYVKLSYLSSSERHLAPAPALYLNCYSGLPRTLLHISFL